MPCDERPKKFSPLSNSENLYRIRDLGQYFNPLVGDTCVGSVDMVRAELVLPYGEGYADTITDIVDMCPSESVGYWTSTKVGSYQRLWAFETASEASFTVGLFPIRGNGKIDSKRGFIEFNPNKVGVDYALGTLFQRLTSVGVGYRLMRADFAFDFPVPRESVFLVKDRRQHEMIESGSFTEYLGVRNKPGRVKLYDKSAESKLPIDVTRLELTIEGDSSVTLFENLQRAWPNLRRFPYSSGDTSGLSPAYKALANALSCINDSIAVESIISQVPKNYRAKLRRALADSELSCVPDVALQLCVNLMQWLDSDFSAFVAV